MFKKIIPIFLICIVLLTSGFGCKGVSQDVQEKMKPVTLEYWRVFDGPDDFKEIIDSYNLLHPFITINYKKLTYEEYRNALLEGFAADRGPDIFSIHNTWMTEYKEKDLIAPLPAEITMVYPVTKGTIKKEVVAELRTSKSLTLKDLKTNFVDVVSGDVVMKTGNVKEGNLKDDIFGLPLSVDTLAMFYNKDLFNNAGIITPPLYWNKEFQQDVKKLTKQDNKGQIIQAGVALGGGSNIERSGDILSTLMMQNGAIMMDESGRVMFNMVPPALETKNYNPGLDALRFYIDFASPAKEVYTWNKNMGKSLDLFTQNKLAIMFGYSYMLPDIKARAPKLNFAVSKLPQIEGNPQGVNFANYWVEVVAKKSKNINEAWDFVQYLTQAEQAKIYLDHVNKPTALRSLVKDQIDNEEIGIFAEQTLTARSWYKGVDSIANDSIITDMINEALIGQNELIDVINLGASKVQQTIKKQAD